MKLLQFELIGQYKSLANQRFDFSEAPGKVIALIGLNGSGKSQLMELIAESFAYLERRKRADFRARKTLNYRFNLAFEWSGEDNNREPPKRYIVQVQPDQSILIITSTQISGPSMENGAAQWISGTTSTLENLPLPRLIGYASGLNENLQRSFMRNALEYFDVIRVRSRRRIELAQPNVDADNFEQINDKYRRRFPGIFGAATSVTDNPLHTLEADTSLPNSLFLDYDCTNLVIAALGLLSDAERNELWPEIRLRHPSKVVLHYNLQYVPVEQDSIEDLKQLIRAVGEENIKGLTNRTTDDQYELYELNYLRAEITIDFTDRTITERLRDTYIDPVRLFWKLYKIQLLGVKRWSFDIRKALRNDSVNVHIKKPLKGKLPLTVIELQLSDGDNFAPIDDLSDGEAQLLHTIGAVRLFGEVESLFIFDEPETHLNPSWRTRYHIDFEQAGRNLITSQALISTHSPFLISSLHRESVFHFERIDGQSIMASPPSETFGASFEVLIKKFFGLRSVISQTAVDEINRHLHDQSTDNNHKLKWMESHLGESMERAYILQRLRSLEN
ncbi:AAA family ATPase [Pseudomonas coleopterorum]|uniref:AAA family ATPase n=1 Tax=Pseudomonas coleopterorum TaxID=1605838 RepID=UPI00177F6642|nr:AAA family ATPase [Pseudomonas coleopterorum]MBD8483637.1 AAA family ATPase [Pseudomonas coleopterorum]